MPSPAIALAPSDDYAVGIDLGGTEIKSASLRLPDGACLHRATAPTRDGERSGALPAFVMQARALLSEHEARTGRPARCVGVSAPGLALRSGTAIGFMPGRLAGLEGLVWREALQRPHLVPVLNDAHAALMGELWLGAARGLRDAVMLTLGTGVGGAIVSGGRLLTGHSGKAGHLGHVTVDAEGAPDICGTPGSLEDAVGEATLSARSGGKFSLTRELIDAHMAGDAFATEVWTRSLRALAAAIVSISNAVDPEAVVLGGGIAAADDHLLPPLRDLLAAREWRPGGVGVRLCRAELGTWAGAFGAAHHASLEAGAGAAR